jgi:hypothetical protein
MSCTKTSVGKILTTAGVVRVEYEATGATGVGLDKLNRTISDTKLPLPRGSDLLQTRAGNFDRLRQ